MVTDLIEITVLNINNQNPIYINYVFTTIKPFLKIIR